jgi:carbohydrate-binding DOMON domain-containing protein
MAGRIKRRRIGAEEGWLGSGIAFASAHLGCTCVRVRSLLVAIPNYARVTGAKAFTEAGTLPDSITFFYYGAFLCG